jgi:hypothetical protein
MVAKENGKKANHLEMSVSRPIMSLNRMNKQEKSDIVFFME